MRIRASEPGPNRWPEVHVVRIGGIGDSLMSTPALRLLKQVRPQIRIDFYSPYVEAFRGLPFLDEVRPLEDYPHPSAVWFLTKPRAVKYSNITDGYRARVETGAGRGRPGAASALCGPERDAPPRPLLGCRRRGRHPRRAGLRAGARRRHGWQTVGRRPVTSRGTRRVVRPASQGAAR